ncbi:MAG: hypothetical protein HYZ50_10995 [Deltaproteobacteria bacterium]|nr:hypothetical protein [Deltaproteobacteria bacterium]
MSSIEGPVTLLTVNRPDQRQVPAPTTVPGILDDKNLVRQRRQKLPLAVDNHQLLLRSVRRLGRYGKLHKSPEEFSQ